MVRERQQGARPYRGVIRAAGWKPPPVLALTGEEEFFKRHLLARILDLVAGGGRGADALTERTATTPADIAAAILDLRTPSFLSRARVVHLTDCDGAIEEASEDLARALEEGLPCGTLVLSCSRLPARTKFAKAAHERDAVVDCRRLWDSPPPWKQGAAPWDSELHEWVVEHAAGLGLKLTPQQAGELVGLTGNAPGVIDQELRKLRDRAGPGGTPTSELIEALVPDRRQDSMFHVVDRALLGDARAAREGVARLLRLGYAMGGQLVIDPSVMAQLAFGALANRLRQLRRCRAVLDQGRSAEDLVAAGLVARPALPAATAQLRAIGEGAVEAGFRILLAADRSLKGESGKFDPALLLEITVLRMAQLASPRPAGGGRGGRPSPGERR